MELLFCVKDIVMVRRLTIIDFISKAKKIHGDLYDYNLVYYVNKRTKVCIVCKSHGEFYQRPYSYSSGISMGILKSMIQMQYVNK